ncbi:hypothetical protein ABNO07_003635 [Salmonella enterica subsp. enterica serovar Bareilly]
MILAIFLSWLVVLVLGTVFTWFLRGEKAFCFVMAAFAVCMLWAVYYLFPMHPYA